MSRIPVNAPSDRQISEEVVLIDYTNWRGDRSMRRIVPVSLKFETNNFHVGEGWSWFLLAWDVDRAAYRVFSMRKIHEWKGRP
jgi:predicted DNA-binding transcriptional regulator YafY